MDAICQDDYFCIFVRKIRECSLDHIKNFVRLSSNPSKKDINDNNLLHITLKRDGVSNRLDIVKFLLEEIGISVNECEAYNITPLHLASKKGLFDCVNLLLEKGANIDVQDHWGDTPLHDASRNKQKECTQILLEYGANRTIKNQDERTASGVASIFPEIKNLIDNFDDTYLYVKGGGED